MPTRTPARTLVSLTIASFAFVASIALVAEAKESKSTQNEAQWISFDAAAKTVTVTIMKKGNGPNAKLLKAKQDVTFNVIPEGSVLTRTSVAVNGVKGELKDIPAGKTVLLYWVPDPNKEGQFFARKIDVVFSEEELDAKYGKEE